MSRGIAKPPSPTSVDDLRLTREKSRKDVNRFLERWHPLGGIPGWLGAFSGRYRDYIVAVCIIGRPVARHADDGKTASITRFARRDDRPDNTGSWLIARARKWVELEGYDQLETLAGVAGNYGTTYEAAGFELVDTSEADTHKWQTRNGRKEYGSYTRRKWVYRFDQ